MYLNTLIYKGIKQVTIFMIESLNHSFNQFEIAAYPDPQLHFVQWLDCAGGTKIHINCV